MLKHGFAPAFCTLVLLMVACTTELSCAPMRTSPASPTAVAQAPPADQSAKVVRNSPREPIGVARNGIFLAYPHDRSDIPAPSTFLAGAVAPGSKLTANGQPVHVNAQGYFAHVVPLKVGKNEITLQKNNDPNQSFLLTLNRPAPPPAVPSEPAQILPGSVQPAQDIGVQPGDTIEFGMRASPGGQASVRIGSRIVALRAGGKTPNQGLDTAFGVTFQQTPATIQDLYTGFYRVTAADAWQNETPEFTLVKDGATVHQTGNGRITVLAQPLLSATAHDETIVRVGPGAGRTTPLPEGVRVLIDGWVGDAYRCEMAPGKHLWIEKADLTGTEPGGSAPEATVRTINIENDGAGGARVVVPLNQRLPFEIKQEIVPANRLQLRIYGATADTDWITEPSTSSHATDEAVKKGRAYPPPAARSHNPVTFVTWQQQADRIYQATINLSPKQQWGFHGEYEGTNLVLRIKGAPHVIPGSLQGLKICVDPGHGGAETGAIGCSGIKESTINLAIAKRTQQLLRAAGAQVIMTRMGDEEVSLADRVKIAVDNHCDLLVSIHNNSLPDGRNPWQEHGTSSYYYHPQSLSLANALRQGVVNNLGFVDFHTRWQNLALCRPSQMPAALVEVGFLINPDEYAALLSPSGQQKAAAGIVSGVRTFLTQALAPSQPPRTKSRTGVAHAAKTAGR